MWTPGLASTNPQKVNFQTNRFESLLQVRCSIYALARRDTQKTFFRRYIKLEGANLNM